MNRLGMVVDVAHATFETTLGVLEASSDPVMLSHSHLAGEGRTHPRLLAVEHARAVAAGGGLVGAWPSGVTSATFGDFVDEVVRLKHRFVDLRRPTMQANLRLRATVNGALRAAMDRQGFVEVETPLLWAPTPEGAREFAVPSRLHQSPQLAKQLLMVAGVDRYYQIARCLRDEDLRADRQFEFSQLDIEASFVDQEDILGFVSEAVLDAAEAVTGERPGPVPRMTWAEALDCYGTDKPDIRFGMELVDLTAVFSATGFRAFAAPCVKAIVLEGGASSSRSRLDGLTDRAKALGAKGLAWFKVVEGEGGGTDVDSPVAKFLSDEEKAGLVATTGAGVGDLVLTVADEYRLTCHVLGALRLELGGRPVSEGPYRYLWVVDFPLFDGVDEDGNPVAAHHPFTMPHPDDIDRLTSDPASVRSQAYDLVLNGWELGSGSVRPGDQRRGGGVPLRLPARCVPLRRPTACRVRRRARPPGGHLRRRGQHP